MRVDACPIGSIVKYLWNFRWFVAGNSIFFHRGIVFNFLRVSNGVRVGDLGSCRCLSMEVFAFGGSWVESFKRNVLD